MITKRFIITACLILAFTCPTILFGAKIKGIVKGVDEEPVPFACISIKNISKKYYTNLKGEFLIEIQGGNYLLTINSAGYSNFEQEIITQVRQFEMLRLQIEITRKSDEVAQERYVVAQNRYLIGKIDITNLNIALTEKDTAKRSYLLALKSFWTAYYNLRRLTLYDFANRKALYLSQE